MLVIPILLPDVLTDSSGAAARQFEVKDFTKCGGASELQLRYSGIFSVK